MNANIQLSRGASSFSQGADVKRLSADTPRAPFYSIYGGATDRHNPTMYSRSGIWCISVSHHFSGMLRLCKRPQTGADGFKEVWRNDGMQALLGSGAHPERVATSISLRKETPGSSAKNAVHLDCTFPHACFSLSVTHVVCRYLHNYF